MKLNLLPYPRSLERLAGSFVLPSNQPLRAFSFVRSRKAPDHPEGYSLRISRQGVRVEYRELGGLRAAGATLRQLLRAYGRRLPCLKIRDWPDFARRGVMLDISRGRVPKLETLLDLVERLADFKINEFQLYTEHTFAYRRYRSVWQAWGALTAREIRTLDARCRELGIDLVPNQNSFGHLRYFLEHPRLRQLAEVSEPYEGSTGDFLRFPTTLAPNHRGTIKFIRELYDELLPNFSSRYFNVGCDETWDLGRGRSRALCARRGKGRVYLDFLKQIHREVTRRGRTMMFWGDIILNHPELIKHLPSPVIALNWGYEATHPFDKEAAIFAQSRIPFYVCPGTATWMSLIGRHGTALANLRSAARAGRKHGASGYLNTDWGDGGHPQPLAVSWPLYVVGAAHAWCSQSFDETLLVPVLSREVYEDRTQRIARAALALGVAHEKFRYCEANVTPFGAVIAAPPPETRELFCRSGLKYYARIKARRIAAAGNEVERQRAILARGRPESAAARILQTELDLAARMAQESCRIMHWQQALAHGQQAQAKALAQSGGRALRQLQQDFQRYWPLRNKATPAKCAAFLQWRREDYRRGKLHFPPESARQVQVKTYAAE
ncbi:MAG TPA: family 20 glycosylhydrolase [Verrucomicrobiota bacterium]|nr:family 20 glycosylhydrolase [Verrucomicrobiota bacterium]HNT15756.1 family 20 glycosylhydrolase [Verrucomicrobiota bacterium]